MSYLLTFFSGIFFCIALLLMGIGQFGSTVEYIVATAAALFLAKLSAKEFLDAAPSASSGPDVATEAAKGVRSQFNACMYRDVCRAAIAAAPTPPVDDTRTSTVKKVVRFGD